MADPSSDFLSRPCSRCEKPCPASDLTVCAGCGTLLSSCELRVAFGWESYPEPNGEEGWYLDGGARRPITEQVLRVLLRLRRRGEHEPALLREEWRLRNQPWQLPKGFSKSILFPEEPLHDLRKVRWGLCDDLILRPGRGYKGDRALVSPGRHAPRVLLQGRPVLTWARVGPYALLEVYHPTHRRTLAVLDKARGLSGGRIDLLVTQQLRDFMARAAPH